MPKSTDDNFIRATDSPSSGENSDSRPELECFAFKVLFDIAAAFAASSARISSGDTAGCKHHQNPKGETRNAFSPFPSSPPCNANSSPSSNQLNTTKRTAKPHKTHISSTSFCMRICKYPPSPKDISKAMPATAIVANAWITYAPTNKARCAGAIGTRFRCIDLINRVDKRTAATGWGGEGNKNYVYVYQNNPIDD